MLREKKDNWFGDYQSFSTKIAKIITAGSLTIVRAMLKSRRLRSGGCGQSVQTLG
jgi:hypothetical protein